MIKFSISGKDYVLKFQHRLALGTFENTKRHKPLDEEQSKHHRGITYATLEAGGEKATGEAKCSWDDPFNYEIGMTLALTRALTIYPREFRKLVWTAYSGV